MNAIERLTAWNEGDDTVPAGYAPDALDFQQDLQWLLEYAATLADVIHEIEVELELFDSARTDLDTQMDRAIEIAATVKP